MTVLATGLIGVVVTVFLAASCLASAVLSTHRAASAADLAALAAAVSLRDSGDPATACRRARRVARANTADLTRCLPAPDSSVEVVCSVPLAVRLPGMPSTATARARAGPDEESA